MTFTVHRPFLPLPAILCVKSVSIEGPEMTAASPEHVSSNNQAPRPKASWEHTPCSSPIWWTKKIFPRNPSRKRVFYLSDQDWVTWTFLNHSLVNGTEITPLLDSSLVYRQELAPSSFSRLSLDMKETWVRSPRRKATKRAWPHSPMEGTQANNRKHKLHGTYGFSQEDVCLQQTLLSPPAVIIHLLLTGEPALLMYWAAKCFQRSGPFWPEGDLPGFAHTVVNPFSLPVTREEWESAVKEVLCGASDKAEEKGGPLSGLRAQLYQSTSRATAAPAYKPAGRRSAAATGKMGPGCHSQGSKSISLLITQPPNLLKWEIIQSFCCPGPFYLIICYLQSNHPDATLTLITPAS